MIHLPSGLDTIVPTSPAGKTLQLRDQIKGAIRALFIESELTPLLWNPYRYA